MILLRFCLLFVVTVLLRTLFLVSSGDAWPGRPEPYTVYLTQLAAGPGGFGGGSGRQ